jgi:hypothetical protein
MVVLREQDRREIDKFFKKMGDFINLRRAIVSDLRKIIQKGDHVIRIRGQGMIRIEDGIFVNPPQRISFMSEYINIGDYTGDAIELTNNLKSFGGLSRKIKDIIVELKLVDDRIIFDTFLNTGDIGKTISAMILNISKINQNLITLRKALFGR